MHAILRFVEARLPTKASLFYITISMIIDISKNLVSRFLRVKGIE